MGRPATEFKSQCECGSTKTVFEWDAGTDWTCSCGRVVIVPSLGKLRQSVGLAEIPRSPAEIVREKVAAGSLPLHGCLECGSSDAQTMPLIAKCEQQTRQHSAAADQTDIALLFGAPFAILSSLVGRQNVSYLGRSVSVAVPVEACESCRPLLDRSGIVSIVRAARYPTGLSGIVMLFIPGWRWWSVGLLLATLGLQLTAAILTYAHFSKMRRMLSKVPEYQALFQQYPRAIVGKFSPDLLHEDFNR